MLNQIIQEGLYQYDIMLAQNQEWENKIRSEFYQTIYLPRKKKKQRRKELNLDFSLQQYQKKMLVGLI